MSIYAISCDEFLLFFYLLLIKIYAHKEVNITKFSKLITILFQTTKLPFNSKRIANHNNYSEKLYQKILKNSNNKKLIAHQLDSLIDEYLDYCNYTNKEYYKAGFIDCLNLILPAFNNNYLF